MFEKRPANVKSSCRRGEIVDSKEGVSSVDVSSNILDVDSDVDDQNSPSPESVTELSNAVADGEQS